MLTIKALTYSPPTTHHLLLTTYYSPPTTHTQALNYPVTAAQVCANLLEPPAPLAVERAVRQLTELDALEVCISPVSRLYLACISPVSRRC